MSCLDPWKCPKCSIWSAMYHRLIDDLQILKPQLTQHVFIRCWTDVLKYGYLNCATGLCNKEGNIARHSNLESHTVQINRNQLAPVHHKSRQDTPFFWTPLEVRTAIMAIYGHIWPLLIAFDHFDRRWPALLGCTFHAFHAFHSDQLAEFTNFSDRLVAFLSLHEHPWTAFAYLSCAYTLWLFNMAMENGPSIDGLPIKNGDFPWLC